MHKKIRQVLVISAIVCAPSTVWAYGECWRDDVPLEARQLQLLINEARSNTQEAIAPCMEDKCLEKACYTGAEAPYFWNDQLTKAAQLHANMHKYYDEASNDMMGIDHNSPCQLVSNIASLYPAECDGQASCACDGGVFTTPASGTKFGPRVNYFIALDSYSHGGKSENIAQSGALRTYTGHYLTTGQFYFQDTPGFFYYVQLLTEHVVSGTAGVCDDDSNNNGHRFSIIGPTGYNMIGAGANCGYFGSNRMHCVAVIEYSKVSNLGVPNALTAGSHYLSYGTLWFKTHYYSTTTDVQEDKVYLNLNGDCIALEKTRGLTKKNEVFGSSTIAGVDDCTPYYFEALDADGHEFSYPTTGSLLYMPANYSNTRHCNGKTWKDVRATSCFAEGPKCTSTQHINQAGNGCEDDSVTACGSYDVDCTQIAGWGTGDCVDKQCTATGCGAGYHPDGALCAADNLDNCGSKGYKCSAKVSGWDNGQCTNGQCVATACKSGFHVYDSSCEADSKTNCGSHGNDCTKASGWGDGKCENQACIATSCQNNFHVYNQACESDSLDHCGQHDFKCADEVVAWANGNCTNGECVASACQDGYHANAGTCESDSVSSCGADKIDCSTAVEGWQSGSCENDTCVPTKCIEGYHVYEQSCELDSLERCGGHDINCANTITDWKSGECQAGECIVSACNGDKVVSNNQCVKDNSGDGLDHSGDGTDHSGDGTDHSGDGTEPPADHHDQQAEITDYIAAPMSDDCSGIPQSKSHSNIWWMLLGVAGLGLWRRRRSVK